MLTHDQFLYKSWFEIASFHSVNIDVLHDQLLEISKTALLTYEHYKIWYIKYMTKLGRNLHET